MPTMVPLGPSSSDQDAAREGAGKNSRYGCTAVKGTPGSLWLFPALEHTEVPWESMGYDSY